MIFSEIQWPETDIAKLMPVPKSNIGNIYWSEEYGFVIYIADVSQTDFNDYVDKCIEHGFDEKVNSGDTWYYADNIDGYHASIKLEDDDIMFIRIDDPDETEELEEQLSKPEEFEEQSAEQVEVLEETLAENIVAEEQQAESVESEVLAEKPVYYSTNTLDKAKSGNAGVFAYRKDGKNYDCYWIIDFDDDCAYFFTYGNSNGTSERVQIDEGDLNNYVLVTYHDGDSTWQYGLCFKRVRQPDRLIQSESDGTQYEYIATDLTDALKILDQMTIVDY